MPTLRHRLNHRAQHNGGHTTVYKVEQNTFREEPCQVPSFLLPSAHFVMEIIKMQYGDATRDWSQFFDQ